MTVPVNAKLRAVVSFDLDNLSTAQNVFHFTHLSSVAQEDDDVVEAIGNWVGGFFNTLKAYMAPSATIEKVECYEHVSLDWEPIGVSSFSWAGTASGQRLPAGVALLLHAFKERTGFTDKKFIAGLTEDGLIGDGWSAAVLTAGGNAINYWKTQYTDPNGVVLLPVSYNDVTGVARVYTGGVVGTVVSYQRRRKPGVGLT